MSAEQDRDPRPSDQSLADDSPALAASETSYHASADPKLPSGRPKRPSSLSESGEPFPKPGVNFAGPPQALPSRADEALSPAAADRVFPIRSVVSVDPTPTPSAAARREGYFASSASRRFSKASGSDASSTHNRIPSAGSKRDSQGQGENKPGATGAEHFFSMKPDSQTTPPSTRQSDILAGVLSGESDDTRSAVGSTGPSSGYPPSGKSGSIKSGRSLDETGPLVTARFKHVVTEGGHAVITGRGGETLQRCEDEPIHIPGAVQGFGLLVAFEEQEEGKLVVRVVSENSKRIIGYTPKQLFALDSFTDILSEDQADNLLDHVDFIRDEEADVMINGPEVFTMSIRSPSRKSQKLWCAMHINDRQSNLVICEFELEDDQLYPLVPSQDDSPELPQDTLDSRPTEEEYVESTLNTSKPLRVLRSARKRKGEAAAMEVFNIMSQVQEQLAAAPSLDKFLKTLVGVVKELTGFHRVMIYQFDQAWNGRVVTELVDPRATKDLYKGLNFPASDIPKQARDLYKINRVRMLYDRDQETARLVCRTVEDLESPLDLTHAYLRAMSPIHLKYLGNMAVRSSMSISINAFDELWGLIACHSYGSKGMRVSFPIRKMCRLVGDSASRNIERLSYASRLQARKLINTVPTKSNPSGYIIASSEDLLKLFDADFGLLSIRDETKILGHIEQSQEALAMLEYLRMRSITSVMTSMDIREDFPDLRYAPGFQVIAGLLIVPLSSKGDDFIVFFRKGQLKEVKWAGNPYEKFIKEGTEGYLEPRKSFRTWSETVVGKCREWTEEEIETAAVLCLVYGKFIEVWRQKEAALQNSQLTRLLLANSAHEVRTPLNAIINYLEIALEGSLDTETRENLAKSHSASKSLIYVINDLLDLTKTEEGGELTKDEIFEPKEVLKEATDMFARDASRKNISYEVIEHPGVPSQVIGDARRVRQAISNITANAIQNTTEGGIKVEMYLISRTEKVVEVEFSISDTGAGMSSKKLDALFRELEQVEAEGENPLEGMSTNKALSDSGRSDDGRTLGLGLAVVARIVRNMNGQLRLKSEEGKGSRFVVQFPFDLIEDQDQQAIEPAEGTSDMGSITPQGEYTTPGPNTPLTGDGEVTLIQRGSARRSSHNSARNMSRKNSSDSFGSGRNSFRSAKSARSTASGGSGMSAADQLIEAIQKPNQVEGWSGSGDSGRRHSQKRPTLAQRHTTTALESRGSPMKPRPRSIEASTPVPQHLREARSSVPGTADVADSAPIKSVRMPDELNSPGPYDHPAMAPRVMGDVKNVPNNTNEPPTADHMRVLVAEDDPVNSRIIKKRLEKLGHEVYLTVNGEECSSAYSEKTGFFDIVLMDMQMPIVDGLTSAKMIRSFEKSHPSHILSQRASLNGRVPIIAVSASLLERERQTYIDAGFDGWTLKPIPFDRLKDIMTGIVDPEARKRNLYAPGMWERGGWFEEKQEDVYAANTKPSEEVPFSDPSEGVKAAAASDDPLVKEDQGSRQTREQERLASAQEEERAQGEASQGARAQSMPHLGLHGKRVKAVEDTAEASAAQVTEVERVRSPEPMASQPPLPSSQSQQEEQQG